MAGRGKIILNGVDYSGSIFEPNPTIPSGAIVTPVTNMKVDDDYYNLVSSGGTSVEANPTVPSGVTPTALTGLKIDNDYYSISGGGGGSNITTFEKTITTTQYGWWWVTDENDNILDPTQHTLLSIIPIVEYNTHGDVYYDAHFFEYDDNQFEPTIQKGYLMDLQDINDGRFLRQSITIKVRVSYI